MRVVGTVLEEESGRPLEGLVVRAYDKDILFDDRLGSVSTKVMHHAPCDVLIVR